MQERDSRVLVSDGDSIDRFIKIKHTSVLANQFDKVIIPRAVEKELLNARVESVQQFMANRPSWLEVRDVVVPNQNIEKGLGEGEREAMALAKELKAPVLLEDRRAFNRAVKDETLRTSVLTPLHVLEEADKRGTIQRFPEVVKELNAVPGVKYKPDGRVKEFLERHERREVELSASQILRIEQQEPGQHEIEWKLASGKTAVMEVLGLKEQDRELNPRSGQQYLKGLLTYEAYERLQEGERLRVVINPDKRDRGRGGDGSGNPEQEQTRQTGKDNPTKVLVQVEKSEDGRIVCTVTALEEGQAFKERISPERECTLRTHSESGRRVCFVSETVAHKEMLELIKGNRELFRDIAEVERETPRTSEIKPAQERDPEVPREARMSQREQEQVQQRELERGRERTIGR